MIHYKRAETGRISILVISPECSQFARHIRMALRGIDAWQAEIGGTRVCQATFG
jgi:hypothetical protein